MPCGNSVMRNSKRTATNSIVVRSARLFPFDGLQIEWRKTENINKKLKLVQLIGIGSLALFSSWWCLPNAHYYMLNAEYLNETKSWFCFWVTFEEEHIQFTCDHWVLYSHLMFLLMPLAVRIPSVSLYVWPPDRALWWV